jgi:hypothetical protein
MTYIRMVPIYMNKGNKDKDGANKNAKERVNE